MRGKMSAESFKVPFNMPSLAGAEIEYIMESIQNRHISGDGPFTKKCQNILESILGVPGILLVTSCTHALEMGALLLDIQKGDEVITPSFTYVSTINAFVLRGAHPVFVDVRPDTMNIDEKMLDRFITPRTKAIVLTHYAGVGCEMDAILDVAKRHGVPLIEDNACSFLGKYNDKYLGTFGRMAAFSFHETKGLSCGQGGALGINDPSYIERAEFIRDKGTDRSKFNRGQVDKYTWVDVGSSYTLSDLLAAYLLAQLENRVEIQKRRRKIWERYLNDLSRWADETNVQLPFVPTGCEPSYSMFYLILSSLKERQAFISHLKTLGILSVFHYQPLHLSRMGKRYGGKIGDCPVAERISDRLVRLPFYNDLSEEDQGFVIDSIKNFRFTN